MKNLFSKIISLCFALTIMFASIQTAFAAEDELTINGEAKVSVGDTVKFSLYLSDCTEEIIGFEMRLFYDSEYLEMDKESIVYEKFDGVIHNPNLEGKFPTSWTNISEPADFSQKALFLSADFKVLKAGDAEISYFVTDMYGDDMTYLKSYKWTYDITVNDETIVTEKTPPVSRDEETLAEKQGSFINYEDGMGEENSPNKNNHQAIISTQVVTQYVDVVQNNPNSNSGNSGGSSMVYIIVGAAIAIVVLAIVAIIIVKKRDEVAENENNIETDV